jgi:small subunit ribosomal protein S20
MPIIKSAKKRVKVARKAAVRNSKTKRSLKASLKLLTTKPTAKSHATAQSKIDTALKKGLVHKNKAARLKRKAAAKAKTNNVKLTAKKTVTKKTPTAKSAAKKTTAKKA